MTDGYQPSASCTPGPTLASTPKSKAGAQCGRSARWDLCGGRPSNGRPYRDPSVVALQEETTNHPKVRRSRAVRAERWGKRRAEEHVRYDPMKARTS